MRLILLALVFLLPTAHAEMKMTFKHDGYKVVVYIVKESEQTIEDCLELAEQVSEVVRMAGAKMISHTCEARLQ